MTLNELRERIGELFYSPDVDIKSKVYLWPNCGDGKYSPVFPVDDVITDTIQGEQVVVIVI